MKKSKSSKAPPHIKDGTYQLIMTSTDWYSYTRHYSTSDSPIVLVSQNRQEALDTIYELERQDQHLPTPFDSEIEVGDAETADDESDENAL